MEWKVVIFLLVMVTMVEISHARHKKNRKPGHCPHFRNDTRQICAELCQSSNDTTCPGDEKCCDNGCGHICHEPVSSTIVIKPGDCPPAPGEGALCVEECSGDGECQGTDKCCNNGCGMQCKPALNLRPKEGICPIFKGGKCDVNCTDDYTCNGAQKCCNNGCGFVCANPTFPTDDPPRTGDCPLIHVNPMLGRCLDTCNNDGHCLVGQRCCNNGCGRGCMDVIPLTPNPAGHCAIGWIQHGGSCYMLGIIPHEYSLAASECVLRHPFGHLADFYDPEELVWAKSFIEDDKGYEESASIWIGLHQDDHGYWVWSDGEPLTYDIWLNDEPDFNSVCAATNLGGYLDDLCINTNKFICEYELERPPTLEPVLEENTDSSLQNSITLLHEVDEAVIAVIAIAVIVAIAAIIGGVVYFIRVKPSARITRRKRGYDDYEKMLNDTAPVEL